jgi:molybdopterin synthase catalytic subunit
MTIALRDAPFEPYAEITRHEGTRFKTMGQFGACAVFVGSMRDFNDDHAVQQMYLEHYPGMTEQHLDAICNAACARWILLETLVIHRVGEVKPGQPIVLVAVWSAHRAEAFEACRFIMEDLKSKAPFWKKELTATGARWVEHNTPGYVEDKK